MEVFDNCLKILYSDYNPLVSTQIFFTRGDNVLERRTDMVIF